jgi:hypothetical protein
MHIFIDESGTFKGGVSVVGALIIPDVRLVKLEKKYATFRPELPQEKGEVKGRLLSERQVASVVSMLARYEVLFEITAIDMAIHIDADIADHKARQAEGLTRNLTDEHHPNLRAGLFDLRRRLEEMADQLYVQSVVTFALVERIIDHTTLFYSQRIPKELAAFHWIIDGKEQRGITDYERWWSLVVMPLMQSGSLQRPLKMLRGSDYSHFERFRTTLPEYLKLHIPGPRNDDDATDLRKLMTESFRFSSDPEPGLEMVDILANATRRAMTGRLGIEGWREIPRLMVHSRSQYIEIVSLLKARPSRRDWPYMSILQHFSRDGKDMIAPRLRRQGQSQPRSSVRYVRIPRLPR